MKKLNSNVISKTCPFPAATSRLASPIRIGHKRYNADSDFHTSSKLVVSNRNEVPKLAFLKTHRKTTTESTSLTYPSTQLNNQRQCHCSYRQQLLLLQTCHASSCWDNSSFWLTASNSCLSSAWKSSFNVSSSRHNSTHLHSSTHVAVQQICYAVTTRKYDSVAALHQSMHLSGFKHRSKRNNTQASSNYTCPVALHNPCWHEQLVSRKKLTRD